MIRLECSNKNNGKHPYYILEYSKSCITFITLTGLKDFKFKYKSKFTQEIRVDECWQP